MITDDDLRNGLRDIAEWGTPAAVPPLADTPIIDLDLDLDLDLDRQRRRRRRPPRGSWWAAAAVLVTMAVVLTTFGSSSPPPVASGSWSLMAGAPIEPRALASSVWTGTEVVVVGGVTGDGRYLRDAAAYNPRTDTWRRLPDAPVEVHPGAVALWTGREVAIFNVESVQVTEIRESANVPPLAGPVALDPATGTWRSLPDPTDFVEAATVVDGRIVALAQRAWDRAAVLELVDDRWVEVVAPPALTSEGFDFHLLRDWAAVTVGGQAVFVARQWMVPGVQPMMPVGVVVDLATRSATRVAQPPVRAPGGERSTVVTSNVAVAGDTAFLLVAWVVNDEGTQGYDATTYDVASATWRRAVAPKELPPFHEMFAAMTMTTIGDDVVVFGGARNRSVVEPGEGGVHTAYVPADGHWHDLPDPGIDPHRAGHVAVWTGTELVVWGGLYNRAGASNRIDVAAPDGAAYRP